MPIGQVAIAQVRRQLVAEHAVADAVLVDIAVLAPQQSPGHALARELLGHLGVIRPCATLGGALVPRAAVQPAFERSEEHTSELQSLMRISYAVFGLKKNNMY